MKYFLKRLAAGFVLPTAITTTIFSATLPINDGAELRKTNRPYFVEVIDLEGNKTSDFRGLSESIEPFSISKDLGAEPFLEDKFLAFPDIEMGIGSKITLYRAPEYKIYDGKKELVARSWVETVGELLKENKITLGTNDKINFSLDTLLETGNDINIIRVAKTTVTESEPIEYAVKKIKDSDLEKGKSYVQQSGEKGEKQYIYEVTREDGVEISKILKETKIVSKPIDEEIIVGTKIISYGTGKATWYRWPSMESKNKYYAASKTIPRGTNVWVVNTSNGKGVKVTILDRVGASVAIDLSPTAFNQIADTSKGVLNVRIEKYYP